MSLVLTEALAGIELGSCLTLFLQDLVSFNFTLRLQNAKMSGGHLKSQETCKLAVQLAGLHIQCHKAAPQRFKPWICSEEPCLPVLFVLAHPGLEYCAAMQVDHSARPYLPVSYWSGTHFSNPTAYSNLVVCNAAADMRQLHR